MFNARFHGDLYLQKKNVKIGYDWKNLCQVHSFWEGNKIIFECSNKSASHIRVFALMRSYFKSHRG